MPYLLALLPILLLVAISLTKGVKPAVLIGWAVTTLLFFYWGAGLPHYLGALGVSLLTTLNILLIVLGAVFLYTIMDHTGLVEQITHSLDKLHPSRELRFFLLAIGLTAFFEGVAGFGTPGAIVPLILMALGFEAVLSVSVVLLFDGLFALFGAVGTPLLIGLQLPLNLGNDTLKVIGITAALLMSLAGLLVLWFVLRLVRQQHGALENQKQVLVLYVFFMLPFCALAWLAPELATVFAALLMLGLSVVYLRQKGTQIDLRPWLPYAVLALLLLLPKLFAPLRHWIGWELVFEDMFRSGIRGGIKPLQSPFLPFVVVGLGVAYYRKSKSLYLKEPLGKMGNVFVVLFPSVAIAQLMIFSGVEQPSMVRYIAELLSKLGDTYPVFAPFIGVMGAFITGSTTISNLVFGASQQQTAASLGISVNTVLALQLAGASIGNAVCLFNIIAAASVANIRNYKAVLANNLVPTLLAALLLGLLGMGWLLV
ncbi:lactate permease [Pontibacter ummariensis]|uniref:L-lactate permease n=1 Tax=Pontibacter ummariensis TaxID=1610492 RepID=A0A239F4H9_9BACT|nr:L-lactate permease [Pontibacter ummariensis]PRY12432.1 lactate permease [Pontibacter ummariensis]SNS51816.1 lactate permease [Pontibacter ummariensis]